VIGARFNATVKENEHTYCVVKGFKRAAKTLGHSLVGAIDQPKEVKWDEHFTIEYEKKDEETFILVEVFARPTLKDDPKSESKLGEFKLKMAEIDAPKPKVEQKEKKEKKLEEETWANAKVRDEPLTDEKGVQTGTVTLRLRRELKLYGTLVIDIKEAELTDANASRAQSAKCVVTLASHIQETPAAEGKTHMGITHYVWKSNIIQLEIDQNNHIFDVFIELWDEHGGVPAVAAAPADKKKDEEKPAATFPAADEKVKVDKKAITGHSIGQVRLTLYDTLSKFKAQLPLLSQLAGKHHHLGTITIEAKLKMKK
jgi:hypothetical protein